MDTTSRQSLVPYIFAGRVNCHFFSFDCQTVAGDFPYQLEVTALFFELDIEQHKQRGQEQQIRQPGGDKGHPDQKSKIGHSLMNRDHQDEKTQDENQRGESDGLSHFFQGFLDGLNDLSGFQKHGPVVGNKCSPNRQPVPA